MKCESTVSHLQQHATTSPTENGKGRYVESYRGAGMCAIKNVH